MRRRLFLSFAFCAAALAASPTFAADKAPTGRWVASSAAGRTILGLYADASFQLTSQQGDRPSTTNVGTYVLKDGTLTLSPKGETSIEFGFVAGASQVTLTVSADGVTKQVPFARDMGAVVGTWHSEKVGTTWVLGVDGSMDATEGADVSKNTYDVVYVEPAAAEGNLIVYKEGSPTLSYHFTIEEKGARLVLGGGPGAKDPTLRIPLERVGAAPAVPATPPAPRADGGPKRPKFPAPPKLPGGGGDPTPTQPAGPVAPATAPAAPPAPSGPTWDTTAMTSKGFKILKTMYDADAGKMTWVVEATRDIAVYPAVKVHYFDADEIRIYDGSVTFAPSIVAKGERVRAEVSLPYASVFTRVVKIVLVPG